MIYVYLFGMLLVVVISVWAVVRRRQIWVTLPFSYRYAQCILCILGSRDDLKDKERPSSD